MNIMIFSIEIILLTILSFFLLYQGFFVFAALLDHKEMPSQGVVPNYRFAVLIPAHNEEYFIDRCLNALLSAHYSEKLRDVYVIADNCIDGTIERANLHPVTCLEREDPNNLGKGHAIQWGLQRIRVNDYDAVLFIDADAVVSSNIFTDLAKILSRGEKAIQVYNGTLNRRENWLTRVLHLSDVLQYLLYFKGREAFGLTCRIIGNGMCLHRDVLIEVPWTAFSITENWEYYHKVLLAGYRVAFLSSSSANSDQVLSFKQGKTQRIRWQAGWAETVKRFLPRMITAAWRGREWRLADAAIDFLLPSPSMQAFFVGIAVIGAVFLEHKVLYWWALTLGLIWGATTGVGLVAARAEYMDYLALFYAPLYIIWKVFLRLRLLISTRPISWVRTIRKGDRTSP